MAGTPIKKEVVSTIIDLFRQGHTVAEIIRETKLSRNTVARYLSLYGEDAGRVKVKSDPADAPPPHLGATDGLDMDGSCEVVTDDRPATQEEIVAACKIDTKVWVAKHYSVTTWEGFYKVGQGENTGHRKVKLFRAKLTCDRIMPACMEQAILDYVRERVEPLPLKHENTVRDCAMRIPKAGFMVSWGVYDAHLGLYAWNEEVGESYDVKIAANRVMNSIDDMVTELSKYPIKKIWMPVGNDFMHFDSVRKKTAFGEHQLDTDSRFAKVYRTALHCLERMLTRALEIAQEVEVIYVPGNHDMTTSYTLAVAMERAFKNEPRAKFDLRASPRKYKQHGGVIICYDHGDGVRPDQYPRIFSQEARDMWATSTYREVQCGHFHQRRERHYEGVVPTNGLLVRVNPALTNCDTWHNKQGLIGEPVKSVEAWRYDEVGYRGSHVVWARDDSRV